MRNKERPSFLVPIKCTFLIWSSAKGCFICFIFLTCVINAIVWYLFDCSIQKSNWMHLLYRIIRYVICIIFNAFDFLNFNGICNQNDYIRQMYFITSLIIILSLYFVSIQCVKSPYDLNLESNVTRSILFWSFHFILHNDTNKAKQEMMHMVLLASILFANFVIHLK